ncbi:hypothetical protein SSUD12_0509 [Streptococcus suis D12]|uniref:Uncharacterized protein n=1 Tax=Streptococcus suis D12 TaxID=1004952 RepID=G7SFC4_STRSU|nr:hypothetical protein SSUD12_0509 [Streptococcus suis D12]
MQKIPTTWSGFSGDYEKYLGLTIVQLILSTLPSVLGLILFFHHKII